MTCDRTPKDEEIQPCRITIPDDEPADLWDRVARVRWAPQPAGGDKGYGVPVAGYASWVSTGVSATTGKRVSETQRTSPVHDHDRRHERALPAHPLARAGRGPLVLSHGWPGSVAEYLDILGPLSDPGGYGLDPTIAFDLVVPWLPAFGFYGPTPNTRGVSNERHLSPPNGLTQRGAVRSIPCPTRNAASQRRAVAMILVVLAVGVGTVASAIRSDVTQTERDDDDGDDPQDLSGEADQPENQCTGQDDQHHSTKARPLTEQKRDALGQPLPFGRLPCSAR